MTRRTDMQERTRGELEDTLSRLGVALVLLDAQVTLRVQQAIRRDCRMGDLLSPALEDLSTIGAALVDAKTQLGRVWSEDHEKRS